MKSSHILSHLLMLAVIPLPPIEVITQNNQSFNVSETLKKTTTEDRDLAETLTKFANITSSGGAHRARFFQIRGIGDREQFEHSQVNPVGIFYDGIDLSEEASALPLFGQENLRVRYGPQTQSWGSKAIAGSLEVKNCLSFTCKRQIRLGAANYDTYSLHLSQSFGEKKQKFFLGASYLQSEGPYFNEYYKSATHNQKEVQAVAGGAYDLNSLKIRHQHIYSNHDNGYDAWNFNNDFRTLSDHPGKDRHILHGHSLNLEKPSGQGLWSAMTSISLSRQTESYDEDWGNNDYWRSVSGWSQDYNYYSELDRDRLKFHQKLSYLFSNGFETGIHYYHFAETQKIRSFKDEVLRRATDPGFHSYNSALWLAKSGTFDNSDWRVSIRGENQKAKLSGLSQEVHGNYQMWGADLELQSFYSDTFSVAYLLQKGFRGGGFNTDPNLPADRLGFGSEELYHAQVSGNWNFESFNLVSRLYSYWYQNQQVRSSVQLDLTDPSSYSYFTTNVGESRSYGLEVLAEKRWFQWRLLTHLGLMQTRVNNYKVAERILNGRDLPHAPRWNYLVRIERSVKPWYIYSEVKSWGDYFYSLDHDHKSKPVELVNLGVEYRQPQWRVNLWSKNLFDRHYPIRAYYFANEPPDWEETLYVQQGAPRTFGVDLIFDY